VVCEADEEGEESTMTRTPDELWERYDELQGLVDIERMAIGESEDNHQNKRVALALLVAECVAGEREACGADASVAYSQALQSGCDPDGAFECAMAAIHARGGAGREGE